MAITTFTAIPNAFQAGCTTIFTESFADFPTTDWASHLILKLPGEAPVRINATVSSGKFLYTLASAATAGLKAGWYDYWFFVTSGVQQVSPKGGKIAISDNPAVDQPPSHAEQMVTTLQAALLLLGATTDSSVSFNGQSFTQASIGTYRNDIVYWQARVIKERRDLMALRGSVPSGFVAVGFGSSHSTHFLNNDDHCP